MTNAHSRADLSRRGRAHAEARPPLASPKGTVGPCPRWRQRPAERPRSRGWRAASSRTVRLAPASDSGVAPQPFVASRGAPRATSSFTVSSRPRQTATCSAGSAFVPPRLVRESRSKPRSKSSRTPSVLPAPAKSANSVLSLACRRHTRAGSPTINSRAAVSSPRAHAARKTSSLVSTTGKPRRANRSSTSARPVRAASAAGSVPSADGR